MSIRMGVTKKETKMEIIHQEFNLDSVIKYFVDGFNRDIWNYEYFCDISKGKVILKLYIETTNEACLDAETENMLGE